MSIITVLGKERQEDHKCKVTLSHIVRQMSAQPSAAWATWVPAPKHIQKVSPVG